MIPNTFCAGLVLQFALCTLVSADDIAADAIVGKWVDDEQDAIIQIEERDGEYIGKIIHLYSPIDEETGEPRRDKMNPDESERDRPVLGMTILEGFEFDGDDRWKGGTLYNPKTGKSYRGYMELKDSNTLKLRGYVFFSFIGRSTIWKRYRDDGPEDSSQ